MENHISTNLANMFNIGCQSMLMAQNFQMYALAGDTTHAATTNINTTWHLILETIINIQTEFST